METIKLDGRNFHGITEALAAIQDDFILTQLRRSGALEMLGELETLSDEQKLERRGEVFTRIVESGRKYKLLAGLLTEEGKTWNQGEAETNAKRFAAIIDTEEKLTMNREVVRHVALFFLFVGESSKTSPKSSNQNTEDLVTASAEAATSGNSPSSFAP
jgi:hypothetical protein